MKTILEKLALYLRTHFPKDSRLLANDLTWYQKKNTPQKSVEKPLVSPKVRQKPTNTALEKKSPFALQRAPKTSKRLKSCKIQDFLQNI